jgi:hypothetical protein
MKQRHDADNFPCSSACHAAYYRTVYVANIDKKVEREDVRNFFEQLCGEWLLAGPVSHQGMLRGCHGFALIVC